MAGMLQILTYMLAFYFILKGIEILQIALSSNRDKRGGIIALGILTLIGCGFAAFSFVQMQDAQALSISQSMSQ